MDFKIRVQLVPKQQRQQYRLEQLEAAISKVKDGFCTVGEASKQFGVPWQTIKDTLTGKCKKHTPGPDPSMTQREEQSLVNYLLYMAERGFPFTTKILRAFVIAIVKRSARPSLMNLQRGPSDEWCQHFHKKHNLSLRTGESIGKQRLYIKKSSIDGHFKLLDDTVKRLNLKPSQIHNMDETGWSKEQHAVSYHYIIF